MQKVYFTEKSERKCQKCGEKLKVNLVLKKPTATHCYKCWKKVKP